MTSAAQLSRSIAPLALIAIVASACGPGTPIRETVRPTSPYEQYVQSLRDAGLEGTALGRDWMAAGERALRSAVAIALPFRESGYLPPHEPTAVGYRLELRRGQQVTIDVTLEAAEPTRLYLDAFHLPAGDEGPRRVASAEAGALSLTIEPGEDGVYVLRLQPELLRGGRYHVAQRVNASMTFPVAGHDTGAVASSFGDPRDAGRRDHHGIDIFAPRGTAVLSATAGWVSSVATTPRGGRVVWVWNPMRGRSIYYAHLDEQLVTPGQRVSAGEEIGRVGNTGNASSTPPHLHFGIYVRGEGPVDPFPFVHEPRAAAPEITADLEPLGALRRTGLSRLRLRAGAGTDAPILSELPRHTVFRVEAATRDWYRVALPDGTHGFVIARATEPLAAPIRRHRAAEATIVRRQPAIRATPIDTIPPDARVPVLGEYEDYMFVRTPDGREGWVPAL